MRLEDIIKKESIYKIRPYINQTNINYAFRYACEYGNLSLINLLLNLQKKYGKIDLSYNNGLIFDNACKSGNLEIVKLILSLEKTNNKIDIHSSCCDAFYYAISKGNLEIAKFLLSLEEERGRMNIYKQDLSFCVTHNVDVLKFLISLEDTHGNFNIHDNSLIINADLEVIKYLVSLEETHGKLNIHIVNDLNFKSKSLNVEHMKYLLSLEKTHGKINLKSIINEAFVNSCAYGNLQSVEYLIALGESNQIIIDIHYNNDNAFICACTKGKLDIAMYLISLENKYGKINIHSENEKSIVNACYSGYLNVVKYLLSLENTHGKIDIHFDNEYIFRILCMTDYLDIIKFILSIDNEYGQINIHANNEEAFQNACKHGNFEIINFILSLQDTYGIINIYEYDNKSWLTVFSVAIFNKNIKLAKFLLELEKKYECIDIKKDKYIDDNIIERIDNKSYYINEITYVLECQNGNINGIDFLITETKNLDVYKKVNKKNSGNINFDNINILIKIKENDVEIVDDENLEYCPNCYIHESQLEYPEKEVDYEIEIQLLLNDNKIDVKPNNNIREIYFFKNCYQQIFCKKCFYYENNLDLNTVYKNYYSFNIFQIYILRERKQKNKFKIPKNIIQLIGNYF